MEMMVRPSSGKNFRLPLSLASTLHKTLKMNGLTFILRNSFIAQKLILIDDTMQKQKRKCVSGVGRFQVTVFYNKFYGLFIFFKNRTVTFLCYDLPSLKHVIIHNIEFQLL